MSYTHFIILSETHACKLTFLLFRLYNQIYITLLCTFYNIKIRLHLFIIYIMLLLKENESNILISEYGTYLKDYYLYILSIIKYVINKNNLSINIILGNMIYDFN